MERTGIKNGLVTPITNPQKIDKLPTKTRLVYHL